MSGARGEAIIALGDGQEAKALFTNRALAEAEQALGRSIIEISRGFAAGRIGITEIGQLLRCGMEAVWRDDRAGGQRPTVQAAYDVMDQAGYAIVARAVMEAITVTLSYQGPGTDDSDGVREASPPE